MTDFHEDPIVQAAFAEIERQKTLSEQIIDTDHGSDDIIKLKDKIAELEFNLAVLREALSSSMEEIVKVEPNFTKIFNKEKFLLAKWINLAKGYKEVAINLGLKTGKNRNDIKSMVNSACISSLNKTLPPINGTNSNRFINKFSDEIKSYLYQTMSSKYSEIAESINHGKFISVGEVCDSWENQIDLWYNLAKVGNAEAQFNIGSIFYHGIIGLYDLSAAIEWLTLSSNQNVTDSYFLLYKIYSDYRGDNFDDEKASFYNLKLKEYPSKLYEFERNSLLKSRKKEKNFKSQLEIANDEINYLNALSKVNCGRKPSDLYRELLSEAVKNKYKWIQELLYVLNVSFDLNTTSSGLFTKLHSNELKMYNHSNENISIEITTYTKDGKSYRKATELRSNIINTLTITEPSKSKEEIDKICIIVTSLNSSKTIFELVF